MASDDPTYFDRDLPITSSQPLALREPSWYDKLFSTTSEGFDAILAGGTLAAEVWLKREIADMYRNDNRNTVTDEVRPNVILQQSPSNDNKIMTYFAIGAGLLILVVALRK